MSKYNRAVPGRKPGKLLKTPLIHSRNITIAFILVAFLSAGAGLALWQASQATAPADQPALLVLPEPREIPPFELVDHEGRAFGPARLQGSWSLLFFGFTHCPDICPGALYDLHLLDEMLVDAHGRGAHQVLFVSVDPERDTPERLKDYVRYFDPDFAAVTGEHEQLEPLTRKLGIAYRIEEHEAGADAYNVDHSASILLMDPQGRLHGVFPAPHDVAAMAQSMQPLLR
jgi:protein SCO1/2